jgi:hypothetical protein
VDLVPEQRGEWLRLTDEFTVATQLEDSSEK